MKVERATTHLIIMFFLQDLMTKTSNTQEYA